MELTKVLKRPIITEKSLQATVRNQYTFEVAKEATKREITEAVEKQFKVEVYAVKVMNRRGKKRRLGRRETVTPSQRRAIVTINPKQKIEIFETATG